MPTTTDSVKSRFAMILTLLVVLATLTGIACNKVADTGGNTKPTPANTAAAAKPAEPEAKKDAPPPVGKEYKPASGPALKSITPTEGTILVGALNDLATSLPPPDAEAAKAANESGTVTVEVIVNEKGEVSTMSVVSGPTSLWRTAGEAARKARFDPPLYNGKPVKIAGVLTYEFKK